MHHQKAKLSASGQELGGKMLFRNRIGFSGTPSDLLPRDLGKCGYERTSDGQMMHVLTNPEVVSVVSTPFDWSVERLLHQVSTAEPHFNALIDTGALITGLSNLEVAQMLLRKGILWCEGVVFLNSDDVKMILVRSTGRVVQLSQCGVSVEKRFAFYDQIHTTGMDIKHCLNARAALTLGKDMVFRDLAQVRVEMHSQIFPLSSARAWAWAWALPLAHACLRPRQGAFRMRGIGEGQTVALLLIPEVQELMGRELAKTIADAGGGGGTSTDGAPPSISTEMAAELAVGVRADAASQQAQLYAISAWLVLNACKSEAVQWASLMGQSLANIWRERAYATIVTEHASLTAVDTAVMVNHLLGDTQSHARRTDPSAPPLHGAPLTPLTPPALRLPQATPSSPRRAPRRRSCSSTASLRWSSAAPTRHYPRAMPFACCWAPTSSPPTSPK